MIDDRHFYLQQVKDKQPDVDCIQIKATYNRKHEGCHFFDWDEIDNYLELIK